MMQDGKALQAATTHDLGTTFSKGCGIKYQDRDGNEQLCHTTSWAFSTRAIGGMIMIHGDDDGMVMPPRLAPKQVVVLPMTKDDGTAEQVMAFAQKVAADLKRQGIRVLLDDREMRTPDKMWDAIKKGIPLRVEIGAREMEAEQVTTVRRDIGRDSKQTISAEQFSGDAQGMLDQIHDDMLARSRKFRDKNTHDGQSVADIEVFFAAEKIGFIKVPVAVLEDGALEAVMKKYSLSTRNMPFSDDGTVLIAKAY
jgi:prolyl-tRNA synthetase